MLDIIDKYMYLFINKNGTQQKAIKNKYIELYEAIQVYTNIYDNINWNERLFLFFTQSIPVKCKHCEKKSKFDSIATGYNKFCSRVCVDEYAKSDYYKKEKIKNTLFKRSSILLSKKFNKEILALPNKQILLINNCSHGNVQIDKGRFIKIFEISDEKIYCDKCATEYLSANIIFNHTLIKHKLNNIINSTSGQRDYMKIYHINLYKAIYEHSKDIKDIKWYERIFLYKNDIKEIPICQHDNCNIQTTFNHCMAQYNKFCDVHSNTSSKELDIKNFLIPFNIKMEKFRNKKYEIDIYIPSLNLGIEFNGLYWHSDKFKEKNYHYNKWKYFNEQNIKLITIWEDDWNNKQDIVKSILTNQLGLNTSKIYARKTIIKEVTPYVAKEFLENNHIQGWCQSSTRLGLYYNNELVSLMTFGKRNIGKKTQFELLRFCNKLNTSVIGGASKLFKHYIINYNPSEVISYANLDISNGKLYETLGFEKKGHTGLNYWWVGDKRYSRNNFMRFKLNKIDINKNKSENDIMKSSGYNKIYGNGNIKYIYI